MATSTIKHTAAGLGLVAALCLLGVLLSGTDDANAILQEQRPTDGLVQEGSKAQGGSKMPDYDAFLGISIGDFAPVQDPKHYASPEKLKKAMETLRAYSILARPKAIALQGGENDVRNPLLTLLIEFGKIRKRAPRKMTIKPTGDDILDRAKQQMVDEKEEKDNEEHPLRHLVEDFRDSFGKLRSEYTMGIGKFITDRIEAVMKAGTDIVTVEKANSGGLNDDGDAKVVYELSAKAIGLSDTPEVLKKLSVPSGKYFLKLQEVVKQAATVEVSPIELWITKAPTPSPTNAPTSPPTGTPTLAPTKAPTMHPCRTGLHSCDAKHGECLETDDALGYACNCKKGYSCEAGCTLAKKFEGHKCKATPTKAPTAAPTSKEVAKELKDAKEAEIKAVSEQVTAEQAKLDADKEKSDALKIKAEADAELKKAKQAEEDAKAAAKSDVEKAKESDSAETADAVEKAKAEQKAADDKKVEKAKEAEEKAEDGEAEAKAEADAAKKEEEEEKAKTAAPTTSAPTKAPTKTPTKAPTPPPTAAPTLAPKTEIAAAVSLQGVTASQFSESAQTSFRESVAENMKMPLESVKITDLVDGSEETAFVSRRSDFESSEDAWRSSDLVQLGSKGLEVKFVVEPPSDHADKPEVKELGSFLESSGEGGFSDSLKKNLEKNGSTMPAPKIKVAEMPKIELIPQTHAPTKAPTPNPTTRSPTNKPTRKPTRGPTKAPTMHEGPIARAMKSCRQKGTACKHNGVALTPTRCQEYSDTNECKACMSCAMPAVQSMCQASDMEDCRNFNLAMQEAQREIQRKINGQLAQAS